LTQRDHPSILVDLNHMISDQFWSLIITYILNPDDDVDQDTFSKEVVKVHASKAAELLVVVVVVKKQGGGKVKF